MKRCLLLILLFCVPFAAFAKGKVDETRLDLLVSIICGNGGAMETSQAAQILPSQGFSMEETQGIVAELEKRGKVVPTAGIATLQLTDQACQ